ncbi:MAG: chorismate synthase [Chloroflexi bacterium RBG_13_50_10]|nr:MAG: chorismate synthase [Chloroflexi bacterium RBG_13_50_10]
MGQFRFLTAGESHGRGLVAVIEGMVAGLPVSEDFIAQDLKRRQAGYGRSARMAIEQDKAEIISGVRHGLTIGSPISLLIWNSVWEDWKDVMSIAPVDKEISPITSPRPGHADLAGVTKYDMEDIRPILERASARETAARVAVGAVARRFLGEFDIAIRSHTTSIGKHVAKHTKSIDWKRVENSPVRCADAGAEKEMMESIDEAKAEKDTLGGTFEVIATGVPVGLGSHVQWDRRLEGQIAQAMMSIPAVKGVEIGSGFSLASAKGSQAQDIIEPSLEGATPPWSRPTNRAGGIEGGISNGQPIVVRAVVKPIATLGKPLPTIDLRTGKKADAHYERSDICVVPAAGVIGEAALAIVLTGAMLEKFGGDHLKETLANYKNYISSAYSGNRYATS